MHALGSGQALLVDLGRGRGEELVGGGEMGREGERDGWGDGEGASCGGRTRVVAAAAQEGEEPGAWAERTLPLVLSLRLLFILSPS